MSDGEDTNEALIISKSCKIHGCVMQTVLYSLRQVNLYIYSDNTVDPHRSGLVSEISSSSRVSSYSNTLLETLAY